MLNRTAIVILVLAALVIGGGIMVGGAVENMANEIANNRTAALAD